MARPFPISFILTLSLLLSFSHSQSLSSPLRLTFSHSVDQQPLLLDSLRYQNAANERHSISRLSYLISEVAFETDTGDWVPTENPAGFIDAGRRILSFDTELPPNRYRAIRFSLGLPPEANHSDPAQYIARHPLNPDYNNLHWTWASGYIFLALEGRYYKKDNTLSGYVYHFANDPNKIVVNIPLQLDHQESSLIELDFDVSQLLSFPSPISFSKNGSSTHSRENDPIAHKLRQNLSSAFRLNRIQQTLAATPKPKPPPIDLPNSFTPYAFKMSRSFPIPDLPTDNPLIEERVALGEKLFFDPKLSLDESISCSACHLPSQAFSDPNRLSQGVSENKTRRHSMPLFNLAWKDAFFWDGRVATLREQIFHPLQDPDEMGIEIESLVNRLNSDPEYKEAFSKAFKPSTITPERIGLALENYLLTLVSYQSKFDQAAAGKATLSAQETRGFELFMTEYEPRSNQFGADCFHCHGGALFSDHQFHNNGLPPTDDLGRQEATGKPGDAYKFSTPSLRNVALTAPYMHDGSLKTLEEVITHYSSSIHNSDTLDPNLAKHPSGGLQLTEADQQALVAFLKTLSDLEY